MSACKTPRESGGNDGQQGSAATRHEMATSFDTLKPSFNGWYCIFVLKVDDKDDAIALIKALLMPEHFVPYGASLSEESNTLSFFVDEYNIALAISKIQWSIFEDGCKQSLIRVEAHKPYRLTAMFNPVTDEIKEKMAEAMPSRYNADTKCLDLSKFHTSPSFTNNNLFVPLNHSTIFVTALNIAYQYTPNDVYSLNFKSNHINTDLGFAWIRRLFPNLEILIFSDNKLFSEEIFTILTGFSIKELYLSENLFSNINSMQPLRFNSYIQKIQKYFPKVSKLDDLQLIPKVISDSGIVPINRGNCYPIFNGQPNQELMIKINDILMEYFKYYDIKTWEKFYHQDVDFSMSSCSMNYNSHSQTGALSSYNKLSRNFLKISSAGQNSHYLFKGKGNVIRLMTKLNRAKHDLESLIIDVPFVNDANGMVHVVVNGVFVEYVNYLRWFRGFCRTFCLMPCGSSYTIISDMLFVTFGDYEARRESLKHNYKHSLNNQQPATSNCIDSSIKQSESFTPWSPLTKTSTNLPTMQIQQTINQSQNNLALPENEKETLQSNSPESNVPTSLNFNAPVLSTSSTLVPGPNEQLSNGKALGVDIKQASVDSVDKTLVVNNCDQDLASDVEQALIYDIVDNLIINVEKEMVSDIEKM